MSSEVDKTKDNIGADKLDNETKKKLYNQFVDAGGEVVSDRSRRRSLAIDREKQKQYQTRLDEHNRKAGTSAAYGKREVNGRTAVKGSSNIAGNEGVFATFFNRLRIKLHLKFQRITQYNGLYFDFKFLERFNNTYKPALMEVQIIYFDLFMKRPQNGVRITQRLDKMNPLFYEVIEMIGNLYDRMSTDQIVEHYTNFPDVPKKVSEIKDPLMEIYRRLYILKPYENTIFNSFVKAIDLQMKIDEKKSSAYSAKKRRVKSSLFVLFHKLYPKLHWLLCHYEGRFIHVDSSEVEDIFAIAEAEKPGNRILLKPDYDAQAEMAEQKAQNKVEKKEEDDIPDHIKRGLQLMYELDLNEVRKDLDQKGIFEHVSDNDKVLITYLLFNEFDREYSFILTTNKIKYNVDFTSTGKFNFGTKFQQLYDEMRKPADSLRNYADVFAVYERTRKEKPASSSQYIAYSKRLQEILNKRNNAGKMARMTVRAYMEKLSGELKDLLDDMDSSQKYVANPQEIMEFASDIEGSSKINGKKVYEAILILYYYCSAFVNRLGPDGDLSGSIEFKEGEQAQKKLHIDDAGIGPIPSQPEKKQGPDDESTVSYTHLRAHET